MAAFYRDQEKNVKTDDDLVIPDFLKRAKDNTLAHPRAKVPGRKAAAPAAPQAQPPEPSPLERIDDPEFRAYVTAEIAAGRVREPWLADASTLRLLEGTYLGSIEKKREALARLHAMHEAKRAERQALPPRPEYGAGTYVVYVNPTNPRKEGTGAHTRYEKLLAYVKANHQPSVPDVLAHAGYRKDDLEWDVARGAVKTDINRTEPQPEAKAKKKRSKK